MFQHQWFNKEGVRYRRVTIDNGVYAEEVDGVEVMRRSATLEEEGKEQQAALEILMERAKGRRPEALRALIVGSGVGAAVIELLLAYGVIPMDDAIAAGYDPSGQL